MQMKKNLIVILIAIISLPFSMSAQVNNVIIETYYVSDANDATDTTGGRSIAEGSKTYRIYVEIEPGSRIKKLYGDATHTLKIGSTSDFYNNIDRPSVYFGYQMNKSWFPSNPTIALDSWLTLGLATTTKYGILKSADTDGSFIGGTNNYGGTAGIIGGILNNDDSSAGIPLLTSDGLESSTTTFGTWSDDGFRDNITGGIDTTVFGSQTIGSQFIANAAYLQQNNGVVSVPADSNKVLIAQLTTTGEISFELNIVMMEPDGPSFKEVKYVAKLAEGESNSDTLKVSPSLTYPQACGCRDPHYLEYSATYACDNPSACVTPVIFGCMDAMACNYDPNANYNVQDLCCYPGLCGDRDIAVVCPQLSTYQFKLYPNPAKDEVSIDFITESDKHVKYEIYNSFGRMISEQQINSSSGIYNIDLSGFNSGLYMLRLYRDETSESKTFLKD
jgi:hypothetical protein